MGCTRSCHAGANHHTVQPRVGHVAQPNFPYVFRNHCAKGQRLIKLVGGCIAPRWQPQDQQDAMPLRQMALTILRSWHVNAARLLLEARRSESDNFVTGGS